MNELLMNWLMKAIEILDEGAADQNTIQIPYSVENLERAELLIQTAIDVLEVLKNEDSKRVGTGRNAERKPHQQG